MNETFRVAVRSWQLSALMAWARDQVRLGFWRGVLEEILNELNPFEENTEEHFDTEMLAHRLLVEADTAEELEAMVRANALGEKLGVFWSYLVRNEPQRLLPFLLRVAPGDVPSAPAWILTIGDPEAPLSRQDEVTLLPGDPELVVHALLRRLELTTAVARGAECLEGRRLEKGVLLEVNVQKVTADGRQTSVRTAGRVRLLDATALLVPREIKAPATAACVTLYRPRRAAPLGEVLGRLLRDALDVLVSTSRPALAERLGAEASALAPAGLLDLAQGDFLRLLSGYVRLKVFPQEPLT